MAVSGSSSSRQWMVARVAVSTVTDDELSGGKGRGASASCPSQPSVCNSNGDIVVTVGTTGEEGVPVRRRPAHPAQQAR